MYITLIGCRKKRNCNLPYRFSSLQVVKWEQLKIAVRPDRKAGGGL